ncbi:MAG: transcriptional regulator [Rhizobiales bacterium]|nr:transcriptional regulator [Hyphomicrobiales bacterium]
MWIDRNAIGSFQPERRNPTKEDSIMSKTSDPDNKPLSDADLQRMKRTPQAKVIRRALNMTQEEFAAQFQIAIGTLRDWEQNRYEPDGAAKAYLTVIAREPEAVRRALATP